MSTSTIAGATCSSARENAAPVRGQRGRRPLRDALPARRAPAQEIGDPQQVVRQHRRAHEHLEPLPPLERATPHATAAQED
jgi:hypothetical protein